MKRHSHTAIMVLVVFALMVASVPLFNVSAGCFGGCDPTPPPIIVTPTPKPVLIDMDENVSFNNSDLGVVLYKVQGDGSDIKMDVYGLKTGESFSSYLFSINQKDIAPYVKTHPAENVLLAEMDGVSVYMLTTGEIQINAGPDSEGKMHIKVLDGIPWTTVYGYTVDAQ
jgi:hypothetical protein